MNRTIHSTLATAALLAAGAFGAPVLAQQQQTPATADKTQAVPSKEQSPKPAAGTAGQRNQPSVAAGGVRDWAAIDKNKDNLIQPDEMEAALKEAGPQAKK